MPLRGAQAQEKWGGVCVGGKRVSAYARPAEAEVGGAGSGWRRRGSVERRRAGRAAVMEGLYHQTNKYVRRGDVGRAAW